MNGPLPGKPASSRIEPWRSFWFAEVPPHVYALLRAGLGGVGLIGLLGSADLATFWWPGGLEYLEGAGFKSFLVAQGLGDVAGTLLFVCSVISALAMMVGFRASIAVPLVFATSLLQSEWNSLPLSSAFQAHRAGVFCLMWVDTGGVWSIDSWLAGRSGGGRHELQSQPIWPLRLIRFQVALIYLSSGLWKILNGSWRDGSALYYVVNDNEFRRFVPFLPPELDGVWILGTYATLLWELAFVVLILRPWGRLLALSLGIVAHVSMWLFLELGTFSFVMLALYLAFLDPQSFANRFVTHPTQT